MSRHSLAANDLGGLLALLGQLVRAPGPEQEDRRRSSRERKTLMAEQTQHTNRIKGLLFSQGISGYEPLRRDRRARLEALRTGDGRPLGERIVVIDGAKIKTV